jgi:hypothetical protein
MDYSEGRFSYERFNFPDAAGVKNLPELLQMAISDYEQANGNCIRL